MSTQRTLALETARVLQDAGHIVYFAGGAVRDQLLGKEPKDYDLATSARPEEVQALFEKSDAVGEHFGVIIVKDFSKILSPRKSSTTSMDAPTSKLKSSAPSATPKSDSRKMPFASSAPFASPSEPASRSKKTPGPPSKNALHF